MRQVKEAFLAHAQSAEPRARTLGRVFAETRRSSTRRRRRLFSRRGQSPGRGTKWTLTNFDAARRNQSRCRRALTACPRCPTKSPDRSRPSCPPTTAPALLRAYAGPRANRRHKPDARSSGRATVSTSSPTTAPFAICSAIAATIDWQPLSARHGYAEPDAIEEAGALSRLARGHGRIGRSPRSDARPGLRDAAPYAVVMAYRVRFYMEMDAREAMHVIELRTEPQGHPWVPPRLPADAPGHRGHAGHARSPTPCGSSITQSRARTAPVGTRIQRRRRGGLTTR